ncbi:MAG: hypothetical protein ACUZ8E_17430 [Candidatus Anammoxibacter sp.]
MRNFKFTKTGLTINSPEAGIHSFGIKFGLEVKNGKLDMTGQPEEKYAEIRDVLLQAGYTFN